MTPPRTVKANAVEDKAMAMLISHGWRAVWFGARAWETNDAHNIMPTMWGCRLPIMRAPDILAAKGRVVLLVEVLTGVGKFVGHHQRCVALEKLAGLDVWSSVAPVLCLDPTYEDGVAWIHREHQWPFLVDEIGHYNGGGNGSGTPFVWLRRELERPAAQWLAG